MGQQVSAPVDAEAKINAIAASVFSEIEKFSFKNQFQATNDQQVLQSLGLSESIPGSAIMAQSAQFLAAYPKSMALRGSICENILKVIAFYDRKLPQYLKMDSLEYTKLLFLSLAARPDPSADISTVPGDLSLADIDATKFYIQFTEFFDFVALLCSVYTYEPNTVFTIEVTSDAKEAAKLILEPFKGPIIGFVAFTALVDRFPLLIHSLQIIWDQLLFERINSPSADPSSSLPLLKLSQTAIKPYEICVLYMARGPEVLDSIRLYQARNDGFSMRAFESKVVNWKAPTILFLKGKRTLKPVPEWDASVPMVTDTTSRISNRVAFAVVVDNAWKVSNKRGFAGPKTTIYQLEPNFSIFTVAPSISNTDGIGYFSPDLGGIGFGVLPPQTKRFIFQRNANIALVLDRFLEHGAFRCIGEGGTFQPDPHLSVPIPYEDRFTITTVETWGIGDERVLAKQKREWEWEKKEVVRRQNVNVGEDRSILELAGIVGQYDPNRGTN